MKKKVVLWGIILLGSQLVLSQDLDRLTENISRYLNDFFADQGTVHASIIKFEDFSEFSDLLAQKFYQLVVSKIEAGQRFRFIDMMINFNGNSGEFDLNKTHQLNYFIFLKLIRNRDKLGAGVVVFSKNLDRIVGVHYHEVLLNQGELKTLDTMDYGFQSVGFSRIMEMNVQEQLLDVRSVQDYSNNLDHFFYYPDKIVLFKHSQGKMGKVSSVELNWGRPYYPALEKEGMLSVFRFDDAIYLTAGMNTSPLSKVFKYQDQQWTEYPPIDFIPFKVLRINEQYYLCGSRYQEGKNHFKDKIILAPFDYQNFQTEKQFEKSVPDFYSLAFSTVDNRLISIHLVDTQYRYRFYSDNFEQQTAEIEKRGSALSSLSDEWLAVSDYSRGNDTIYFYKIKNGSRQLVYQNKIDGEIVFISDGQWESFTGFWILVRKPNSSGNKYVLQFWSKGTEPATDQGDAD